MVRCVPALLMLLSHMLSMLAPVAFVQCVERDGRQSIQPLAVQCTCCKEHIDAELTQRPKSSETCCSGHHQVGCAHHRSTPAETDEQYPIVVDRCGCRHSQLAMDSATPTSSDSHGMKSLQSIVAFVTMLSPASTAGNSAEPAGNSLLALDSNSAAPLRALSSTILRC